MATTPPDEVGPARLEAQKGHREVAIADTYTIILRPTINRIAESIQA